MDLHQTSTCASARITNEGDQRTQAYMEQLYLISGRDEKDHPMHATYTGLYEDRKQRLIEYDKCMMLGEF